MATNGVIILDLGNRNAAYFDRILVPGCYDKVAGAEEAGGFVTCYKWLYQGFIMAPSVCIPTKNQDDSYTLTDKMKGGQMIVYPDDTIYLSGAQHPSVAIINPLLVAENGVYNPPSGVDGYAPVTVNVSEVQPVVNPLVVIENGVYSAPSGVDGYSPVTVNVNGGEPVLTTLSVVSNGNYSPGAGVDGFSSVSVNVPGAPVDPYLGKAIRVSVSNNTSGSYALLVEEGSADDNGVFTPNGATTTIVFRDVIYRTLGPMLIPGLMVIGFDGTDRWLATYVLEVQQWLGSSIGWNYISAGGHPASCLATISTGTVWGIWRHPDS